MSSLVVLHELAAALPDGALVLDPDVIEAYRRDRADTVRPGRPLALVRAGGTDDVRAVLRTASRHRVPVVPRGAGSGLSGGASATDGCLVLSLERLQDIVIDPAAMLAEVGAGVLNGDLKLACREHGLWYPPDPSSFEFCSIGGNLATNAGGLCCVRYGVTTDYVLGAGAAVTALVRAGSPSLLELMDRATVRAVEAYRPAGLDVEASATVLLQGDSPAELVDFEAVCRRHEASYVAVTDDPDEGEMFLRARREAFPALFERGTTLIEDVGVPIPRIAELVTGVERIAERHETSIATVGHAGDGNLHPLISFDPKDEAAVARADEAFGAVVRLALSLGGTLTGEHGVGTVKARYLADQLGPEVMAVSRRIKSALDPLGILNPGKVFG
jgi:glycolate oxidase